LLGGTNGLGGQLATGMQLAADTARQGLTPSCYGGAFDTHLARIRDLIERNRVDGLVLWLAAQPAQWTEAVAYLQDQNIPFVMVPEYDPEILEGVHTVATADGGATADIMAHLLGQGHREIGYVYDALAESSVHHGRRYGQYRRSLTVAGLTPRDPLPVGEVIGALTVPALAPELVPLLREVTAVFCETDREAAVVHRACVREGIRIPQDLAVVGFDNSPLSRYLDLTSVEQHFEQLGRRAVELLQEEIEGKLSAPVHLEVVAELMIRSSSLCQVHAPPAPRPGQGQKSVIDLQHAWAGRTASPGQEAFADTPAPPHEIRRGSGRSGVRQKEGGH